MSRWHELVVIIVILAVVQQSHGHAKTFTRCQLSRELLRYNFPRSLIPNWVCLIEHASGRTTDKVTNHNNSYTSYGLFQIHNKDWCKKGRKGGHCNMNCEERNVAVLHRSTSRRNSYDYVKRDDFATHLFKSNFKKCSTDLPSTMLRTLDEDFYVLFVCIAGFLGVKMNCYLALQVDDLVNEDLADDVRCAKRIYDRVGFKAWPSSYSYCKEKSLPDLSRC